MMLKQIEIKRWDNDKIIVCGKYESIRDCLEKNKDKSFRDANLRSADLSSADLSSADLSYANLSSADLSYADLSSANLSYANLSSANLSYANLSSANLSYADLSYANLRSANLRSANLSYADLKKIPQLNNLTINEYIKKYKIEKRIKKTELFLIFYKGVKTNGNSPIADKPIKYEKGKTYSIEFADCDVWADCSCGISVSPTVDKAKKFCKEKILKIEVNMGDIACIPIWKNHEKIRVKKCKVIGEVK